MSTTLSSSSYCDLSLVNLACLLQRMSRFLMRVSGADRDHLHASSMFVKSVWMLRLSRGGHAWQIRNRDMVTVSRVRPSLSCQRNPELAQLERDVRVGGGPRNLRIFTVWHAVGVHRALQVHRCAADLKEVRSSCCPLQCRCTLLLAFIKSSALRNCNVQLARPHQPGEIASWTLPTQQHWHRCRIAMSGGLVAQMA